MQDDRRSRILLDLFERHYERVYAFARRSVDPASAEDIAQEVFLRVLDLPDLETRAIAASYLVKIADNLMKRRFWRRRKLESIIDATARDHAVRPATPAKSDASARQADGSESGELASSPLRPGERDVLDLVVCRGLSYQQAASSLGVRVSDVNNWKHRGIQRLKQHARSEGERADRAIGPGRRGGGFGQKAS